MCRSTLMTAFIAWNYSFPETHTSLELMLWWTYWT